MKNAQWLQDLSRHGGLTDLYVLASVSSFSGSNLGLLKKEGEEVQRQQLNQMQQSRTASSSHWRHLHACITELELDIWTDSQIRCWQNLFPSSPIHWRSAFIVGELLMLLMANCCWTLTPFELPQMVKVIALLPLFNKHVTGCYMIPSLDFLLDIYLGLYFLQVLLFYVELYCL